MNAVFEFAFCDKLFAISVKTVATLTTTRIHVPKDPVTQFFMVLNKKYDAQIKIYQMNIVVSKKHCL
jgi:hypothetical protein